MDTEIATQKKIDFDEELYLENYPDVAKAVKSGAFQSGLEHYELHGRAEGRRGFSQADRIVAPWMRKSDEVTGWCRGAEAYELFQTAYSLVPHDAIIAEVGAFLGSGSILLAGTRAERGAGKLHCIDPFDCSGDAFSVPIYERLIKNAGPDRTMREIFENNIANAGIREWVVTHEGGAVEIARSFTQEIDLLFMDGDQSPAGARAAYDAWMPFLKIGGYIAVHNSGADREYAPGHDGHQRVVVEELMLPRFADVHLTQTTTFGKKIAD
jgi:predicted O-methyltransferase YrrM